MPEEVMQVDKWTPNWNKCCEVCGQKPCAQGKQGDKVVYDGDMCGVCTWGEAACADPANW